MRVLVFGAGVIGVVYAWQLSEAGQDVTLLVRPGRKEALLAAREGLAVCRARGINPMSLSNIRLLYLPLFMIVPFTKRAYQGEEARLVFEGHAAHAGDEMQVIYHEVLADGERLGVKMPNFCGFKDYVERLEAPVTVS